MSAPSIPRSRPAGAIQREPDQLLREDRLALALFVSGAAALGCGVAGWLSLKIGFPGSTPRPDVVGSLLRFGGDKGAESGFFYYSIVLVALFGALAHRFVTQRLFGHVHRDAGGVLALGGLLAVVSVVISVYVGDRDLLPNVVIPATCLASAAVLARRIESVTAEIRRRVSAAHFSVARSVATCAACITVFVVSISPYHPSALLTDEVIPRLVIVAIGSIALSAGLAWLLTAMRARSGASKGETFADRGGEQPWRALEHAWPLPLVRFAPESGALILIVLLCAVVGVAVSSVRAARRPARGSSDVMLFAALASLVLALVFDINIHGQVDVYHEGERLTPANEMLRGKVPFRDIYLQHGLIQSALSSYWTFLLLGPTLVADRISNNFQLAATHVAFLLLCLQLLRSRALAFALALAIASPAVSLQSRALPYFAALACAAWDVRLARADDGSPRNGRRLLPLLCAGLLSSCALFWSLENGLYAMTIILVFLCIESCTRGSEPLGVRLRPFASFAAGLALGALPFLVYLGANCALGEFVANSLDQMRLQLSTWGVPYPSFADMRRPFARFSFVFGLGDSRFIAGLAAATLVLLPLVLLLRAVRQRFGAASWRLLLLTIAGIVSFRTALGRSDEGHFIYATALLWPIFAVIAESALRGAGLRELTPSARTALRIGPLALLTAWFIVSFGAVRTVAEQWARLSNQLVSEPGPGFGFARVPRAAGVLMPSGDAQLIGALATYLDQRLPPGAPFVDFSDMGALYFLLDRECPTRYVQAAYAVTPAMQQLMIAELEWKRPRYMIESSLLGLSNIDRIPLAERVPLVARYLEKAYAYSSDEVFGRVFERVER